MAFDPQTAVEFLRLVDDAESQNRIEGLEDLRFSNGEQWLSADIQSRQLQGRPRLTINKIDAYIRQVTNAQRQQRPRIKVHPMDADADKKIAEVLTGLTRHIEVNSDADNAYDTAFNYACRVGWGYFRLDARFTREDSMDQDLYIDSIENPFTVYFDPNSVLPDGSDQQECLITDMMRKSEFKKMYSGADPNSGWLDSASGDDTQDWITKYDIRVAEYFKIEQEKDMLVMLDSGSTVWASQEETWKKLLAAGRTITGDRPSFRKKVMWRKVTLNDVLEEKPIDGRYIPVFPVYGDSAIIEGKRKRFGMVRYARDPQIIYNFERTAMVESLAMHTKAKFWLAEGQDEGHENELAQANVSATPYARYKRFVNSVDMGPPIRITPEMPTQGLLEGAQLSDSDLQAVLGIYDPSMGKPSGPKSGKAIKAEQGQSEQSNYHYFDNLTRTMKHLGRVILDRVPYIYDKQRIVRIIGADGKPDLVTLNEKAIDQIDTVKNNVTVGLYDVVMDVGPSYDSKRQEDKETFNMLLNTPLGEEITRVGADLVVRTWDGMDTLADRLAAANPMAQIDDKSDVPLQAQMQIKQLQATLQQAQQQIQGMGMELKYKGDLEKFKQGEETKRAHLAATVKAHDTESWVAEERNQVESVERTKLHDTMTRAIASQNVAEITAAAQLMLHHMDTKRLKETAETQDRETATLQ